MKKHLFIKLSLLLLLVICNTHAWGKYLYLSTANFTNWEKDNATFKLYPGTGSKVNGVKVYDHMYRFDVTAVSTSSNAMMFGRYNNTGGTKWNEFSVTYSATYDTYEVTGWTAGSCANSNITEIYLDVHTLWYSDGPIFKLTTGGTTYTTTGFVGTNLVIFSVPSPSGTLQFERWSSDNKTKWNELSTTYNSSYNTYEVKSWSSLEASYNIKIVEKGNYIYFDNSQTNWSTSNYKYLVLGHDKPLAYSGTYTFSSTPIPNTKLWYYNNTGTTWRDVTYFAFIRSGAKFDSGDWGSSNMSAAANYTGAYEEMTDLEWGKLYLFKPASGSNGASLSLQTANVASGLNTTQTIKYAISIDNGSTYSELTEGKTPAQIQISAYKFNDGTYNSVSSSSNSKSISANTSGTYSQSVPAGYTASTSISYSSVQSGYTFVDWKDAVNDGNTVTSPYYPTGEKTVYARFKSILVTSITLNKTSTTLTAGGDTETLTTTVLPANALDKTVTWSTSNSSIATVSNGVVTPRAEGTCTITATAHDGSGKSATCTVTVEAGVPTHTLTWNLDGGTATGGTAAGSVAEGAALTPPTVTKVGYDFAGWSPAVPATMPSSDATYTATWTKVYASGTYQFDGHLTVGTSPSYTVTTTATNYTAKRADNIFFSATKIEFEGTDGTPEGDGDNFKGWKVKASTTIKFFVEDNSDVQVSIGSIGGGTCTISYTDQSSVEHNNTAISAGSYETIYEVKAGTMVTISMAPSSDKSITLKRIAISGSASCVAPTAVNISGTYHYFPGETISLTAAAEGGSGTPTTYQWYKGGTADGNIIEGATSATYTKATCTFADAGSYYCKVTRGGSCSTFSGNYDVKILRLYVKYSKGGDPYGNVDFVKVNSTTARASISLGSNWTYGFNIADGCGHYYGNSGTMQYNSYGPWVTNQNGTDCGLTTTNAATYIFTINYSNWEQLTTTVTFPATDDKTEPTVTWSGVPATVYPGQQFTFTVETNTDASLVVGNLTATNAILVNRSIEGGVFTATAQIAANAAAAPTFTLSTAEGTSYSAKVDTKSGITLGSCESSSGTATLFAFTCTSTTTAINTYSATGGTATLSGSAMSDKITIDKIDYYKFNSSSQWTMALTSGTFAVGDVITFTMACNTGSNKTGKGVILNNGTTNKITLTRDYLKNTAQESSYRVVADDGIAGQSSFTIKRNDSDIKFGTVTVTRAGQSLDNKQETIIEWPETVDGVRVVEYDPENRNIPSLAIISSIGEATYTSNNEDVGSFRDGNVELNGGYGNVTITVSVAAVGCMEAAESSYVLTVTPKRYSVEKGTITAGCDVTLSAISVSSGEAVTLTPVPADGYSLTTWDVYKKGDSNTKVTVTNNRFTMPDYDVVVDATFTAKSTVATLSALSVTNADTEDAVTLSPTFESGTTAYTATLSCGTTSAPRISASKTDSKATTRLTNVSDLSGDAAARTATIVVTAEDGVTTQTYTIVFTVSAEGCVRLAPSITSISEGEDICSGGTVDLSVTAESRNNDGGTLSYQWQKYNGSWNDIAGATEADYTTDPITVNSKFRCVVSDTKDEDVKSTTSDEITIGVTSVATPTYTQGANVVTLSCATEGATIWYSTDGNDPAADADNSRQGTSVSITRSNVTVKAIAYLEGCRSAVMTLENAAYSSEAVDGSITWAMTNAGEAEAPKFTATCVPNTVLSAATAFTLRNDASYDMSTKSGMSVKISGITSYSADGKHVSLNVTVADGYTFTPCSLSVRYQPVSKAATYKAVIGSYTSSESESVSAGSTGTQIVTFSAPSPSPISGTEALHIYVYGTDLTRWRLAGNIILYGTVQTTGTTYYSVTYNRNGATSGTIPVDDNLYENGDEVELAANTGNLARTGYIFSGWSTTPGGTALESNPTISSNMTLYAVWTEDESVQTEACANVTTSGTQSSIAVGDYSLYFSSSNSEYTSSSVKSSTANKCEGDYRYYMPGVVVALTNSNATTIKLKGQQDYDVTVSKVMVADALDGAWKEISYTPVAYTGTSCGVLGISGVQIAQGKYVFLGFSGGAKNEFRISGLCITPFTDPCPSISIVNNPVGDTWAKDAAGVQISVGATTTSGTLNYQWQVSTDNTNFSDIDAATATTYNVPTGTVGTKYYRCVVSNGACSKNSESAKMVIVEPTVTALYDYWYIKQSRQTPDIALFEVTKGTPASNVTIPAAEIGKYGFVYNTSDYKIYLQGSAPSAIYSDEDVEVTASIKSNSNADNITLHLLRATPHPQLAFVVTGDKGAGFENYNSSQITSDLYTQLALEYVIQPTNIYHTTDEKAIRAYYSQFDIILNTDYPDTQIGPNSNSGQWNVGYVNALGTMVDIVPILTLEAFISRLPNWKIKNDPKSPSTNQYSMLLNCRAHEIFSGIPAENMGTEYINGEEHKVVTIVDENDYDTKKKALQGFAADDLADMDVVGQIHNGDGQLMACVERQYETTARMMVLGINSSAMEKLTEDGIKVVKNALLYLQHKSAKDVNDCSVKFTNNDGAGNGQWSTASNWSTGVVPSHENKVIILADCELDEKVHVDMIKINEDAKLTIKPTGALIVDGTITRFSGEDWLAQDGDITSDNLVVEADASNTGALILSNPDSKIGAEVQMYSKARYDNVNSKDLWQFVAIPIVSASRWNMGDWAYVFNNAGGDWDYYRDVYSAFDGIGLTQDDETTYTFRGPLASTKTQNITLYYGNGNDDRTLIGNSWTAPIQIVNFDESKDFGTATPTVYVYNTGFDAVKGQSAYGKSNTPTAAGSWYTIPIGSAKELIAARTWVSLTEIPAMQTFEVQNTSGANTTLKLDYDALVRKDASSLNQNTPMYAPRRANNNVEIPSMRITLVDEATRSDVYLLKADRFTNGFEGGWDGDYRVDDDADYTQFYIVQETGKLAISAQPEMDGTYLGFVAGRNASYTITFRYNGNEELYFNDLETQQSTLITDENEYTFMAERGEKGNRFLIGGRLFGAPEIATGVTDLDAENLDVQKVIYNDKLFIIRGGKVFSADGQLVK